MQVVDTVVGGQGVRLAAIEGVDLGVLDTVGDAADDLAEEAVVVRLVGLLGGEAENDVGAIDVEGLDDGTQGDEGGSRVRHFGCLLD